MFMWILERVVGVCAVYEGFKHFRFHKQNLESESEIIRFCCVC